MHVRLSGYSRSDGFTVSVRLPVSKDQWFIPFHVPKEHVLGTERFDVSVAVMLVGLALVAAWLHLFLALAILAWVATQATPFQRQRKSWHWCEHQVVDLIAEGLPLTEGLMRSESPVTPRCGSVYLISRAMMYVAWVLATVHTLQQEVGPALFCLSFAWSAGIAHQVSKHDGQFGVLRYLGSPALWVAMVIQRMFFLRKPHRIQSEYALAWGLLAQERVYDLIKQDSPEVDFWRK